jgi:D-tyrosyl-tRNA(Tyr) deacylase
VHGEITGTINHGLLVLIGIEDADDAIDMEWLAGKIVNMRIFNDDDGVMNKSLLEVGGEILLVSQFTLHASTRKGNRPSYIRASKPDLAKLKYNQFIQVLSAAFGRHLQTGVFGADMQVELINDGPVTIIIDTKNKE